MQLPASQLAAPTAPSATLRAGWRDYLALTRPRVLALLAVITLTTMFVAAESLPPLVPAAGTLLGGMLLAAGANALNQFYDRDLDELMIRTRRRPLPAGRMAPQQAWRFGWALAALGLLILTVATHWLALALAALGFGLYVLVYSRWAKRRSPHAIIVAAVAGAMAVLAAWAAVTGGLHSTAILLAAIMCYWLPGRAWSLALQCYRDYARAHVPILPVLQGSRPTRAQILAYAGQMVVASLILIGSEALGPTYGIVALLLGVLTLLQSVRLFRVGTPALAAEYHRFMAIYLVVLCLGMTADRLG
jgi:protoheme IX farnesyltransferase